MKLLALFNVVVLSTALVLKAQTTLPAAHPTPGNQSPYSIVERGPHHRVWERIEYEPAPDGRQVPLPRRYVELATGLHYWDKGQWKESQELIEAYPGGAVARHGQHKVIFAYNLATAGAIDMELPDGKRLRSHVLGLAYFDAASGKTVLIAEVKDCVGVIVEPNQVLYQDAFDGLRADVRYTYTRAGFEQDVILHERPLGPEAYGLDPANTRLQVWTEFVQAPRPSKGQRVIQAAKGHQVADELLDFGSMHIGSGKAFTLGEGSGRTAHAGPRRAEISDGLGQRSLPREEDAGRGQASLPDQLGRDGSPSRPDVGAAALEALQRVGGVPVGKQWLELEGRRFLVEEVPVGAVADELLSLPVTTQSRAHVRPGAIEQFVAGLPQMPERSQQAASGSGPRQLASAGRLALPIRALVLDYVILNSGLTNYTFRGDTTYLVSGWVNLFGTSVFEGGTVVKYATNTSATLALLGQIVCQAAPHRPAVFTSMHDNSVGETISGSTGNPTRHSGSQGWFWADNCQPVFLNMRFLYAGIAIGGFPSQLTLQNCQLVDCGYGIAQEGGQRLTLRNCLFSRCEVPVGCAGQVFEGEYLTVDRSRVFAEGASSNIRLTNCIFACVTNLYSTPPISISGSHNGFYNSTLFGVNTLLVTNNPFQSSGIHNPYLETGYYLNSSSFQDKGDRSAAQAGLYHYTTRADQAREASSMVDLGYHYLAVNGNGEAFDSDGDGTPDYIEDSNGNGTADTGEPDSNRYVVILHPLDSDMPESQRRRVVQQHPGGANRWLATFTPGARTVILAGPARTNFQEVHLGTNYWVFLNSTNNPGGNDLRNTNLPGIWVRTLPEPFNGAVPTYWLDAALAANNSGVDDILAIAWQYISGAQPAPTWENYGKQDRGDARYGPLRDLNCTGPCDRYPGGDFNDYLGIAVYWPPPDNFTAQPKYNAACTNNMDCATNNYAFSLDCSGFVRMVFGYRRNMEARGFIDRIPLCFGTNATGLPRRADWQFNFGPGVVIIPHVADTVPTNFAKMQVGDLVFFEYPNTAAYEYDADYVIDHVGIYLGPGRRTGGLTYHYFISSRGKLDGPTIGSAAPGWGGQSILDGNPNTFYWVGAYRCVRRL